MACNEEELGRLRNLEVRGRQNGLEGIEYLEREAMLEVEPNVGGIAALRVPLHVLRTVGHRQHPSYVTKAAELASTSATLYNTVAFEDVAEVFTFATAAEPLSPPLRTPAASCAARQRVDRCRHATLSLFSAFNSLRKYRHGSQALRKSSVNNITMVIRDRPFERTLTLHKVKSSKLPQQQFNKVLSGFHWAYWIPV